MASGAFRLSIPTSSPLGAPGLADFWTTQYPYQLLPERDPALLVELKKSALVIFKGDLNYRKCVYIEKIPAASPMSDVGLFFSRLVADGKWAPTTPFEEALGQSICCSMSSMR